MTLAKALSEDLQECKACGQAQYILNPDTDDCQPCPPGLACRGDDMVTVRVAGSTWVRNGSFYRLTGCPTGYRVVSWTGSQGVFDAAVQECQPCSDGTECTLGSSCVTCSACAAGKFKALQSASPCQWCPADTYNSMSGSKSESDCKPCPALATTNGRTGQTSLASCACPPQQLSLLDNVTGQIECKRCPKGGICASAIKH